MSFYSNKEKMECNDYKDICRNHSAKTDREMFRVCPSKLSKRELEDLYFTLLENNLDLKKTINGQQDKIRVLSTQVQRMTNTQERLVSKEVKDRGTVTKAVVDEQKDFISELKETNQRLTDRIQQLNMRLCSAKQFMKTTPPQSAPFRGNRSAATAVSTPKKHDCLSKSPESSPEQVIKVSTFSQWEEKSPRKTNQTQNNVAVEKKPLKSDQPCDENKCRTLMEELKLRIATLQDELLNVHDEYATRISRLETEVMEVRKENIRVLSERSASELELTESCKRANKILAQYRSYEAKCAELKTELAIEKRKVAELETQLKAAKMSDKVNKTIEDHLTTKQDKKNNVECRCPAWVQDGLSKLSSSQEANPKCMKCCYKDQLELELPPPKTDEGLAPSAGVSSLKGDPNSTSFNTGDDSGYQDTEQALIKQNKELMTKVLDLQRQVDCLKIGEFCGMPECQSESLNEVERIPTKTADKSAVTSAPPLVVEILKPTALPEEPDKPNSPVPKDMASTRPLLLKKPLQAEIPVEQIAQLPKGDNNEQIISIASDHNLDLTKKILRIEPLGNPEKTTSPPVQGRTSEDTRAKTIEGLDGTQYIADDALKVPDKYGYPDIPNNEYRDSRASPKFKIVEKKKLEGSAISIMPRSQDPLNISLKSVNLGPGFNPEKLKYLEAEGLTTETPRVSLTESIPSNPELGFGIPRLTTKPEQVRSKAENDSPSTSNPTVPTPYDSVVPRTRGKLTLHATHSDTPEQTDDTLKDKEDCQYCDSCFFDKECTHTIQPTMNKLAPGMQKEHARIQIPGPSQSLDSGKKDKKINIISQLKNHKKENQSAENLIVNSKIYAKKTSQTVGGPVTLPDVPLLEKREQSTNDYNYKGSEIDQKTLTHNKKDKSGKRRKGQQTDDGLSINSRIFAEKTCETADGPVTLPDVPLLEKAVQEGSKYGPAKDSDEGNAKQKNTDKSSQAPGYKAWQGDALYSRRSGTNCIHRGQQTQGPHVCRCVSQPDGGCSQKPRNKGTQVADTAENTSPKEKRRAPMSDRGTYTLESKPTATSPDNTDLEMSYLSDLPMEKDKKSPLKPRPLSPGEDKMTTSTSTSYGTSPPTDYSLSEGEMPAPTTKRRLSIPDRDRIYVNSTLAHKEETPPVQQMEAALQAITDELQRCKHLLHRHRPEHLATNSIVS